ncbi:MAG: hypothetical protein ABL861_02015 [Nitrosomonas sp.]
MKETIREMSGAILPIILFSLYIFGMYSIIADDHRYTTKDVVIAAVIFPYPWWVGGKEIYRLASTSSEDRALEEKCLDATEAIGLKQKSRLRFCECMVEMKDENQCKLKIFGQ